MASRQHLIGSRSTPGGNFRFGRREMVSLKEDERIESWGMAKKKGAALTENVKLTAGAVSAPKGGGRETVGISRLKPLQKDGC